MELQDLSLIKLNIIWCLLNWNLLVKSFLFFLDGGSCDSGGGDTQKLSLIS